MKRFALKRITALVLALIMTLSLMPMTVWATEGNGSEGEENNTTTVEQTTEPAQLYMDKGSESNPDYVTSHTASVTFITSSGGVDYLNLFFGDGENKTQIDDTYTLEYPSGIGVFSFHENKQTVLWNPSGATETTGYIQASKDGISYRMDLALILDDDSDNNTPFVYKNVEIYTGKENGKGTYNNWGTHDGLTATTDEAGEHIAVSYTPGAEKKLFLKPVDGTTTLTKGVGYLSDYVTLGAVEVSTGIYELTLSSSAKDGGNAWVNFVSGDGIDFMFMPQSSSNNQGSNAAPDGTQLYWMRDSWTSDEHVVDRGRNYKFGIATDTDGTPVAWVDTPTIVASSDGLGTFTPVNENGNVVIQWDATNCWDATGFITLTVDGVDYVLNVRTNVNRMGLESQHNSFSTAIKLDSNTYEWVLYARQWNNTTQATEFNRVTSTNFTIPSGSRLNWNRDDEGNLVGDTLVFDAAGLTAANLPMDLYVVSNDQYQTNYYFQITFDDGVFRHNGVEVYTYKDPNTGELGYSSSPEEDGLSLFNFYGHINFLFKKNVVNTLYLRPQSNVDSMEFCNGKFYDRENWGGSNYVDLTPPAEGTDYYTLTLNAGVTESGDIGIRKLDADGNNCGEIQIIYEVPVTNPNAVQLWNYDGGWRLDGVKLDQGVSRQFIMSVGPQTNKTILNPDNCDIAINGNIGTITWMDDGRMLLDTANATDEHGLIKITMKSSGEIYYLAIQLIFQELLVPNGTDYIPFIDIPFIGGVGSEVLSLECYFRDWQNGHAITKITPWSEETRTGFQLTASAYADRISWDSNTGNVLFDTRGLMVEDLPITLTAVNSDGRHYSLELSADSINYYETAYSTITVRLSNTQAKVLSLDPILNENGELIELKVNIKNKLLTEDEKNAWRKMAEEDMHLAVGYEFNVKDVASGNLPDVFHFCHVDADAQTTVSDLHDEMWDIVEYEGEDKLFEGYNDYGHTRSNGNFCAWASANTGDLAILPSDSRDIYTWFFRYGTEGNYTYQEDGFVMKFEPEHPSLFNIEDALYPAVDEERLTYVPHENLDTRLTITEYTEATQTFKYTEEGILTYEYQGAEKTYDTVIADITDTAALDGLSVDQWGVFWYDLLKVNAPIAGYMAKTVECSFYEEDVYGANEVTLRYHWCGSAADLKFTITWFNPADGAEYVEQIIVRMSTLPGSIKWMDQVAVPMDSDRVKFDEVPASSGAENSYSNGVLWTEYADGTRVGDTTGGVMVDVNAVLAAELYFEAPDGATGFSAMYFGDGRDDPTLNFHNGDMAESYGEDLVGMESQNARPLTNWGTEENPSWGTGKTTLEGLLKQTYGVDDEIEYYYSANRGTRGYFVKWFFENGTSLCEYVQLDTSPYVCQWVSAAVDNIEDVSAGVEKPAVVFDENINLVSKIHPQNKSGHFFFELEVVGLDDEANARLEQQGNTFVIILPYSFIGIDPDNWEEETAKLKTPMIKHFDEDFTLKENQGTIQGAFTARGIEFPVGSFSPFLLTWTEPGLYVNYQDGELSDLIEMTSIGQAVGYPVNYEGDTATVYYWNPDLAGLSCTNKEGQGNVTVSAVEGEAGLYSITLTGASGTVNVQMQEVRADGNTSGFPIIFSDGSEAPSDDGNGGNGDNNGGGDGDGNRPPYPTYEPPMFICGDDGWLMDKANVNAGSTKNIYLHLPTSNGPVKIEDLSAVTISTEPVSEALATSASVGTFTVSADKTYLIWDATSATENQQAWLCMTVDDGSSKETFKALVHTNAPAGEKTDFIFDQGTPGSVLHNAGITIGNETYYLVPVQSSNGRVVRGAPHTFEISDTGTSLWAYTVGLATTTDRTNFELVTDTTLLEKLKNVQISIKAVNQTSMGSTYYEGGSQPFCLSLASLRNWGMNGIADQLTGYNASCEPVAFLFDKSSAGVWELTVSAEVDGAMYTSRIYKEAIYKSNIYVAPDEGAEDVIENINAQIQGLKTSISKNLEMDLSNTTIVIDVPAGEHTGYIEVPGVVGDNAAGNPVWFPDVVICGSNGDGETVIHGGVCADNRITTVNNIRFIGAGKTAETWAALWNGSDAPNYGFYGTATGSYSACSFSDYYYAMKSTNGTRFGGDTSIFYNNHIALSIDIDPQNYNGGNPDMRRVVFAHNDVALELKAFAPNFDQGTLTTYQNVFYNNVTDVDAASLFRSFFMPSNVYDNTNGLNRNFTGHVYGDPYYLLSETGRTALSTTNIGALPLGTYDKNWIQQTESGEFIKVFPANWKVPMIYANADDYVIPANELKKGNMTIDMVDNRNNGTNGVVATMKMKPATMSLMRLRSVAVEDVFNPLLEVTFFDDDKIIVTMNAVPSGVEAELTIPCVGWSDATVTDEEGYKVDAIFADGTATFSAVGGTYIIYKKSVPTVTAPKANELTYTGEEQALVTAGTTSGGTMKYSLDGETYSTDIPTGTDAKTYEVWYKVEGNNYNSDVAAAVVEVTIAKADASVTAPIAKTDLKYTGESQALITAGSTADGTMQYSLDGETYSTDIPTGTDAKTYTVYYKVEGDANHNDVAAKSVTVTIAKAPLTVTANVKSIIYGAVPVNAGVEYKGFVNGETEAVLTGTLTYSYNYEQYGNVGDYAITPAGLSSDNYEITFVNGTLTVEQKEIGITWSNTELIYNGRYQKPDATATGTVNGDEVTLIVSGEKMDASDTAYTATVTEINGGKAANYKLPTDVTEKFTIAKQKVTKPVADTAEFIYSGAEQTYAVAANDAYTVNGNVRTDAGSQTVTVALKDKDNYEWSDETTADVTFTFTIAKATQGVPEVTGVNETVFAKNDGKITGVTSAMEYSVDGETYTAITDGKLENLAPDTYYVRYAEKNNFLASGAVTVVIAAGEKITVTFDTNDGNEIEKIENLAYGDKVTEPAEPKKSGYTFGGWFSDEACTKAWDFDKDTVSANMTLYAKWNAIPVVYPPYIPETPAQPTTPIETKPTTPAQPTTPPAEVTVPVSGEENTINVEASVSGSTATIDKVDMNQLDGVIGDDVAVGTVTIDFSVLESTEVIDEVEIPVEVVKEIAAAVADPNNDAESLEIILSDGASIEFDAAALAEKVAQAGGADITISIKHAVETILSAAQQTAVGDRVAFDINVTSGGVHISDMGGKITIHAPYELRDGETADGIVVYYVDDEGNMEKCETSYNSVKKRINWKTDHLSVYMIAHEPPADDAPAVDETPADDAVQPDGGSSIGLWIGVALVVLVIAIVVVVIAIKRKKA